MRRFKYILILSLSLLAMMQQAWAQDEGKDVRRGNRDFRKENWKEAEIDYRKALVKDSLFMAANYNLANTLYRVEDFEQARKIMENVSDIAPASESAADYYYNLGDIAIALQDWQGAVDAFKESLLLNPGDINAKENYIYAKKMLGEQQNQEQQDQNQQGQNDQDNDQNDDQQDQNQDQNQDQDGNGQNDDNPQDQDRDQNQGQQPRISPQAAQQMLQAIQAREKETQDKVNRHKAQVLGSRQKEKNW